jgi:hypothetical protein
MYTRTTKRLTLRTQAVRVTNSSVLRSYALKSTLLPRLASLSVDAQAYPDCELGWIPALFCSSILEIKIVPRSVDLLPSMTPTICADWLDAIAVICPELHTLCVYPYSPWLEWDESAPAGVQEAEEDIRGGLHIKLARLTQLRHVSINMYMTRHNDMAILGGFPHLECLEIRGPHQLGECMVVNFLEQNCFPELQRLAIHHTAWHDIYDTLNPSNPLLHGLATLDLVVDPRPVDPDEPDDYEGISCWLYRRLGEMTCPLTSLTIRFDLCPNNDLGFVSREDLELLARLPLEYASFHKVYIDGFGEDDPCLLLAETWPKIVELHWPDQRATTADLVHFESLPNLQHLTLDLQLTPASDLNYPLIPNGTEIFHTLECSKITCAIKFSTVHIKDIAK